MVQSQEGSPAPTGHASRMRIGEFAARAGVSVDAVRFYERRGVLAPAPRTPGGYRTFDERDLSRMTLARRMQRLGLTVEEVVDALSRHDTDCRAQRWRLEQVQTRIENQLKELRRTQTLVRDTLAACDAGSCRLADPDVG